MLMYLGQYVRLNIAAYFSGYVCLPATLCCNAVHRLCTLLLAVTYSRRSLCRNSASKSSSVGPEVVNALLFVRKLGAAAIVPAAVMERCVPLYVLEAAVLTEAAPAGR